MKKAILVIDMPKSCDGCPCEYDYIRCKVTGKFPDYDKRPKWCPLKPIPQKLDENDWHRMFSGLFSERMFKGLGWNACIDMIIGEEE